MSVYMVVATSIHHGSHSSYTGSLLKGYQALHEEVLPQVLMVDIPA